MPDYIAQLSLQRRIGGGQFGDVYEGECPVHGKVAVKLLRQNPSESDADWAARSAELIAEARRLKSAQHRNIVAVHQIVKDGRGVVHLVTEFCHGGSLEEQYRTDPMPILKARKVITDVSAGLECVHSAGMVHRDIKPANILCEGTIYKIGDFGLVTDRMVHGYASAQGYVSHLAPEVFDTSSGVAGVTSAKSDIWALGMTLYRLLHGEGFFLDNFGLLDANDFQQRIVNGGFSQSLPWIPHIPDRWRRFVRKSMHDDSGQRFQSAHELSQALAVLPIEPNWICHYVYNHLTWKRMKDGRTTTVEWEIRSPRKHCWSAIRSGGGKNPRFMAGTRGNIISATEVKKQLEDFFESVA
jgi:eukaryotic-like serine/threonine-protein kinase